MDAWYKDVPQGKDANLYARGWESVASYFIKDWSV